MAKIRRNGPCPCGSGSKAKRCCETPHAYVDVRVLPLDLCQDVANDLPGTKEVELRTLLGQLIFLPEIDTSLQVRLPETITPDMERAINSLRANDDEFDDALGKVVAEVDTIGRRVELARALIELRNEGRIPPKLAAVAVFELDRRKSTLFLSSVAESLEVLAREPHKPTGLVASGR